MQRIFSVNEMLQQQMEAESQGGAGEDGVHSKHTTVTPRPEFNLKKALWLRYYIWDYFIYMFSIKVFLTCHLQKLPNVVIMCVPKELVFYSAFPSKVVECTRYLVLFLVSFQVS